MSCLLLLLSDFSPSSLPFTLFTIFHGWGSSHFPFFLLCLFVRDRKGAATISEFYLVLDPLQVRRHNLLSRTTVSGGAAAGEAGTDGNSTSAPGSDLLLEEALEGVTLRPPVQPSSPVQQSGKKRPQPPKYLLLSLIQKDPVSLGQFIRHMLYGYEHGEGLNIQVSESNDME